MPKTKINIQTVSGLTANSKGEKGNANNIGSAVNGIRYRTDYKVLSRNGNSRQFSSIQSSISDISMDIGRIFQTIESATEEYRQTEEKVLRDGAMMGVITPKYRSTSVVSPNSMLFDSAYNRSKFGVIGAGVPVGMTPINGGGFRGEKIEEKKSWIGEFFKPFGDSFFDTVADAVGEVGIVGKIGDGFYDFITGIISDDKTKVTKASIGILKPTVSIIGDIVEEASKSADKIDWKKVFLGDWKKGGVLEKVEEVTKAYPKSTKWGAAFWDDLSSFTFKNADTVGDKIKVGAKWIGTGLSAVTNGIDNHADYKKGEMSAERAVKETIMETVVDVGIGAAATATATVAVGAAATALGFAAPVALVGVTAVGITWAADSVTKWATKTFGKEEKSLTEFTSDVILDVTKGAGDILQKAGSGIANTIGNIGAKWRTCFG